MPAPSYPEDAIEIKEVVNGKLNIFDAGNMLLVAGELYIGITSSDRLTDIVKKRARQAAEKSQAEMILTDGPPGIDCPIIASVRSADYVVPVIEPKPAALNDLKRVVEVVNHFNTPLGIALNRPDIHPESNRAIKQFAHGNCFSMRSEIPYDKNMPMAVANAQPVVSTYPTTQASLAIGARAESLSERLNELP